MSDSLSETSGVARKMPFAESPPPESPTAVSTDDPAVTHFLVRWESRPKDGDKYKWFPIFARDYLEAARFFSMSCDLGNPRPPARRVAVVRLVHTPDPEDELVAVEVRPSVTYTVSDA